MVLLDALNEIARANLPAEYWSRLDDPDAALVDMGFDSLKMVALILDIERRLGVRFDSDFLISENFATLRAAADTVGRARRGPVETGGAA